MQAKLCLGTVAVFLSCVSIGGGRNAAIFSHIQQRRSTDPPKFLEAYEMTHAHFKHVTPYVSSQSCPPRSVAAARKESTYIGEFSVSISTAFDTGAGLSSLAHLTNAARMNPC